MSHRIWKYWLDVAEEQDLVVPLGAQPLTVQLQQGRPMLWAVVAPDASRAPTLTIFCRSTNQAMTGREGQHLGTVQMPDGDGVYHYFTSGEGATQQEPPRRAPTLEQVRELLYSGLRCDIWRAIGYLDKCIEERQAMADAAVQALRRR